MVRPDRDSESARARTPSSPRPLRVASSVRANSASSTGLPATSWSTHASGTIRASAGQSRSFRLRAEDLSSERGASSRRLFMSARKSSRDSPSSHCCSREVQSNVPLPLVVGLAVCWSPVWAAEDSSCSGENPPLLHDHGPARPANPSKTMATHRRPAPPGRSPTSLAVSSSRPLSAAPSMRLSSAVAVVGTSPDDTSVGGASGLVSENIQVAPARRKSKRQRV
jgi:hypothetical protein